MPACQAAATGHSPLDILGFTERRWLGPVTLTDALLNGQAFWWCAWFRICKQERCANIEEPLYRVWSVECRCRLTRHRLVKIVISSADRSPTKLLIFIHVMYSLTCTTPPRHTHNPELGVKKQSAVLSYSSYISR